MLKANFCYEKVTEESAQFGECSEHGWILPAVLGAEMNFSPQSSPIRFAPEKYAATG